MRWDDVADQHCSVARSMAILGDRWTMLLVREAFFGTSRFEQFVAYTGGTPQIVSSRLKRLVDEDILSKSSYSERPSRFEYELTPKGRDLRPVLIAIMNWGDAWLHDGRGSPNPFRHVSCGHITRPVMVCSECREEVSMETLRTEPSKRLQKQRMAMLSAHLESSAE
ncbi:winged helix-turn-helix transcriptional regulator [Bradyrhizobium sp. 195]|uniref:winged helix-turn-helix transcriptional regulator n=1 Tax=Bradyrhizobium sp. 195 TaxID=2782662 RepID=UPI0020011FAC|nr:helix-turn-helix domain-containing protein [Bradyrhizobium sp. 195]UPK28604.1 helix-turn-helix transcriptional regulator [Bradyrhizobium sp. 195]